MLITIIAYATALITTFVAGIILSYILVLLSALTTFGLSKILGKLTVISVELFIIGIIQSCCVIFIAFRIIELFNRPYLWFAIIVLVLNFYASYMMISRSPMVGRLGYFLNMIGDIIGVVLGIVIYTTYF